MSHQLRHLHRGGRLLASVPPDMAVVAGYVVCFDLLVAASLLEETPLRPLLALPFLFFLPGYVIVAVLFPTHGGDAAGSEPHGGDRREGNQREAAGDRHDGWRVRFPPLDAGPRAAAAAISSRRIDLVERAALSFGASVAVLPWFGLFLAETPWGFRTSAVTGGLSTLVLAGAAVGTVRRLQQPEDERFGVPLRRWIATLRAAVVQPARPLDAAVNAALVLSVVVALSTLVYGLSMPNHQAAYTDFYLVTENDSGTVVAADYPTEFTLGEGQPVTIGIENREGRPVTYGVAIELQRVRLDAGSATVLEEQELARLRADVDADATWTRRQPIVPELVGEDLRVQFYLYEGEPPSDPSPETAYRHLYLWIDVSEGDRNRVGLAVERGRR